MTLEEIWAFTAAIVAVIAFAHFVLTVVREKRRAAGGRSRFGVFRMLLAAVAAGVAIFSGGCSLFFLANLSVSGPQQYLDWTVVLIVGGIPFAIAALIWWLSMRRGKTPESGGAA
jgi:hypothetical protein